MPSLLLHLHHPLERKEYYGYQDHKQHDYHGYEAILVDLWGIFTVPFHYLGIMAYAGVHHK